MASGGNTFVWPGLGQALAGFDAIEHEADRIDEHAVADGLPRDGQSRQQRHAILQQGAERPAEADHSTLAIRSPIKGRRRNMRSHRARLVGS